MGRRDNGNENRHDKGGWKQTKKMGGKEKEYEKYRELLSAIIRINASKYIDIYTYKKHINFDLLIS